MTQSGAGVAVVAVAGRRTDADGATPERFPLRNRDRVRADLARFIGGRNPVVLVSSAACGADLLALEAASVLGIRFRVVLPFTADRFRASSVIDRPGDWGPLFDRLVTEASLRGDLVVMNTSHGTDDEAYAAANVAILDEGDTLAASARAARVALIVWEGSSRGAGDLTDRFKTEAMSRGWGIQEVRTL